MYSLFRTKYQIRIIIIICIFPRLFLMTHMNYRDRTEEEGRGKRINRILILIL